MGWGERESGRGRRRLREGGRKTEGRREKKEKEGENNKGREGGGRKKKGSKTEWKPGKEQCKAKQNKKAPTESLKRPSRRGERPRLGVPCQQKKKKSGLV
jgi:hypothetical protein